MRTQWDSPCNVPGSGPAQKASSIKGSWCLPELRALQGPLSEALNPQESCCSYNDHLLQVFFLESSLGPMDVLLLPLCHILSLCPGWQGQSSLNFISGDGCSQNHPFSLSIPLRLQVSSTWLMARAQRCWGQLWTIQTVHTLCHSLLTSNLGKHSQFFKALHVESRIYTIWTISFFSFLLFSVKWVSLAHYSVSWKISKEWWF